MRAWRVAATLVLLTACLTGCEGVITGTEVARTPLQPIEGGIAGAYVPVKFNLGPEMNPLAFNFRADFSQNPAEFGKWNTYRITLTQGGVITASRNVNINHPQGRAEDASPPPTGTVHTLFIVDVQNSGEYELAITPVHPVAIVLSNSQVDVRRNVQRPPQ